MKYRILSAGSEIGFFDGVLKSDARGNYVEAPLNVFDIAIPGVQLRSEAGDYHTVQFQSTSKTAGNTKVLLYFQ